MYKDLNIRICNYRLTLTLVFSVSQNKFRGSYLPRTASYHNTSH